MNVYPFIEAEKGDSRNVARACELLEVSGPPTTNNATNQPWPGRHPMPT